MRMYGHGRGTCIRVYEFNAPCGFVSYGGAPAKVVYEESCIRGPMEIVYHGAYRRESVNVPIKCFPVVRKTGGRTGPEVSASLILQYILFSAMRLWVHGTSYLMSNYKLFEL